MVSEILSLLRSEQGGAFLGTPRVTSLSVLLNASHHEKHEYVWFRGGDQNGFGNFMK